MTLQTFVVTSLMLGGFALNTLAGITPQTTESEVKSTEPSVPDTSPLLRDEVSSLQLERDKLAADLAILQAKLDAQLAPRKARTLEMQTTIDEMKARLDLADWQRKAADDTALTDLRRQNERLTLEANVAKLEAEIESCKIKQEENEVRRQTSLLALGMELQQKEQEARSWAAGKKPAYLKQPLAGKKLIISDRRIALNGVITPRTADEITERINYFTNRDPEALIFIVIDDCPGGSVMAGYKILKAMHGSNAPVYAVVKSFAASMAACITTLAEKSFAYPNAIILHHQLSGMGFGNLTQQKESVKEMEEWWRRLADPVAAKMGITRDEFITRMYAASSTGDWDEFADDAQKLKWVDVIVEEIEETSTLRHPDSAASTTADASARAQPAPSTQARSEIAEAKDERGKPIAILPRLNPLDAYWMYSPDGYYRMQ